MKKAELQESVPVLLRFFNDYIYHQFEISADGIPANADEYRITPANIRLLADSGENRTACFAELGLEPFEHTRTTKGETISSPDKKNFLIMMFYRKIKDENEFARVLFHEAGHTISAISSPDYAKVSDAIKIDSEEIKTVKLGAMIWSECIAETIANRVYEEYIARKEIEDGVALGSYLYHHKFIVQDGEYASYYIKNDHEGIIGREMWDTVQARLKQEEERKANGVYSSSREHFMHGKLFCGDCGMPMTRRTICYQGKQQKVWKCKGRLKDCKSCKNDVISEEDLFKALSEHLGIKWKGVEAVTERMFDRIKKVMIFNDGRIEIELNAEKQTA